MKVGMVIETDKIIARYQGVERDHAEFFANALARECRRVLKLSQDVYCPVVSGALRDSGYVNGPSVMGRHVEVDIGYDKPYAVKVHEQPKKIGQHKNKYLSKPAYIEAEKLPRNLASVMTKLLSDAGYKA